MADHAIAVSGLTYHYGEKVAVDHLDFEVAEGEIIGFLGPNGAGKTTTVKMLTGQLVPREGKALVLGLDVAREAHRVQARHRGLLRADEPLRKDERGRQPAPVRAPLRRAALRSRGAAREGGAPPARDGTRWRRSPRA